VTGTVAVDIILLPPNLTITSLTNGSIKIVGSGVPGRTYHIQFSDSTANWQILGEATADVNGVFVFTDSTDSSIRLYRSVYP
jgi:hypothetical protein